MSASEELQRELNLLMNSVTGLQAIAITDRDGVPLVKATKDSTVELRTPLLASACLAMEQSDKLSIGKCRSMVCEYDNYQVVNFNIQPFNVSLIATKNANTGHLLSLRKSFAPVVEELAKLFSS